jgi:hypothetical protein
MFNRLHNKRDNFRSPAHREEAEKADEGAILSKFISLTAKPKVNWHA